MAAERALTGAEIVAERLYAAGVRHAFGLPGGEVLTLVDALVRAGIAFHLAKHENAAGFMAEGTWHATGAPAVLVATVGPGIANAFNVVANAEQDRVPLIVIAGMIERAEQATYTHQVFDHGAVFARVCKASFELADGAVDVGVDKAIAIAMEARKGPVHLDLPISLAAAEQPKPRPQRRGVVPPAAPGEGPALAAARALFAKSERPVLVAGLDVLEEPGGAEALLAFAEAHAVPIATTYKAKGVIPETHPLSLGGHGLSPRADAILMPKLAEADCVIAAGYDPIEMRTGWRDPWDPSVCIEFAHAPNRHDMHHAALSWVCSVSGGLAALHGARRTQQTDWMSETRNALVMAFSGGETWGPDVAMAEMLAVLPENALTTADSG
ncbi:MAG: thiamine pyrophosphate-binding protein, partial [Pseudomonadota bacterium]